jgi:hypothetical protein
MFDSVSSQKFGVGFIPITPDLKPAETCYLLFYILTMRKIVICAPVSSFVAVSGCFRFPSPTPEFKAPAAKIKSPQIYGKSFPTRNQRIIRRSAGYRDAHAVIFFALRPRRFDGSI